MTTEKCDLIRKDGCMQAKRALKDASNAHRHHNLKCGKLDSYDDSNVTQRLKAGKPSGRLKSSGIILPSHDGTRMITGASAQAIQKKRGIK